MSSPVFLRCLSRTRPIRPQAIPASFTSVSRRATSSKPPNSTSGPPLTSTPGISSTAGPSKSGSSEAPEGINTGSAASPKPPPKSPSSHDQDSASAVAAGTTPKSSLETPEKNESATSPTSSSSTSAQPASDDTSGTTQPETIAEQVLTGPQDAAAPPKTKRKLSPEAEAVAKMYRRLLPSSKPKRLTAEEQIERHDAMLNNYNISREMVQELEKSLEKRKWKPRDVTMIDGVAYSDAAMRLRREAEAMDPEVKAREVRPPRAVHAIYLAPLRRKAEWGIPTCDIQLRSYNVRNLEFFADFAIRAAYYCNLPAFGPVPLPKITERWTVPKSPFIFKKSQENFERITHRRLIQIKDGHTENVTLWLGYLRKHMLHGIGVKANVWEWCSLNVGEEMDNIYDAHKDSVDQAWSHIGDTQQVKTVEKVAELLSQKRFHLSGGRA